MDMSALIDQSNIDDPIGYFRILFSSNALELKKEDFYPDPDNEDDDRNRFPYIINKEKESYEIEYPVYKTVNDDNDGYYEIQDGWKTITVSFELELYRELKNEYAKSKKLIEENLGNQSIETAKLRVLNWLDSLENLLNIINRSAKYAPYKDSDRPIKALIRNLFLYHPSLCPKPNATFKALITEKSGQQLQFEEKQTLTSRFFFELVKLVDSEKNPIIEFENVNNAEEIKKYADLVKGFYNGTYTSPNMEINFSWGKEPICYILAKFHEFDTKINLRDLQDSNRVKIKSEPFNATKGDKNASTYRKKHTPLKAVIDDLFLQHTIR